MDIRLIDCPACRSKVSSQAAACPHCGQPIRLHPYPVSRPEEKSPSTKPDVSNARVLSILSIIFSAGVFFSGWGLLFVVAGIVLGHIAVKKGDNLGKVGYVLGYIALGIILLFFFTIFENIIEKIPKEIMFLLKASGPFFGFLFICCLIPKDQEEK